MFFKCLFDLLEDELDDNRRNCRRFNDWNWDDDDIAGRRGRRRRRRNCDCVFECLFDLLEDELDDNRRRF
ncbi:MAG TPA: hypothetical protein GX396_09260 [Tissierellia bacterium]|nr:hypothetical protein [Tissierellia bacterium]